MKNLIILTLSFFLLSSTYAQDAAYINAMQDAITTMNNDEDPNALKNAINKFSRIAKKEKTAWLPLYYIGLANTYLSFGSENEKDELADQAKVNFDKAIALTKTNQSKSEIITAQGLAYIAKMMVDPMSRAQEYGMKSATAFEKALVLEPTNPRAKLMQISSGVGKAQYFKEDPTPFYNEAKKLVGAWDDYVIVSEIHPVWGKKKAKELAAQAKEVKEVNTSKAAVESNDDDSKEGNTLIVKITKLNNDNGVILLSLKDENDKLIEQKTLSIHNHEAIIEFDHIQSGKYVIKYHHDENNNKKMDKGSFGIPKEGYGYSNDARGSYGPPKLKDMIFSIEGDTTLELTTKYH